MGSELPHIKVKLVMPVLYSDQALLAGAQDLLQELYGETDFRSPALPFNYTRYYNREMGPEEIKRIFFAYKKLIKITDLVKIKKETDRIELELSVDGRRHVNLDPGISNSEVRAGDNEGPAAPALYRLRDLRRLSPFILKTGNGGTGTDLPRLQEPGL